MTNRRGLRGHEVPHRVSQLLAALEKSGDNSQLIAQRARLLLQWAPGQADGPYAWLRNQLPDQTHYDKTMAALATISRPAADTTVSTPPPAVNESSRSKSKKRSRERRR